MAGGVSVRDVDVSASNVSRHQGQAGYRSHARQAQPTSTKGIGTGKRMAIAEADSSASAI
jgi:hypothetical protein